MIITTTITGFTYYLKRTGVHFTWQGLINNATEFTRDEVEYIAQYVKFKSSLKLLKNGKAGRNPEHRIPHQTAAAEGAEQVQDQKGGVYGLGPK